MEMTISKDKVERILTDYYRSKEDIKGINWSVLWLVAGGFALGTCLDNLTKLIKLKSSVKR